MVVRRDFAIRNSVGDLAHSFRPRGLLVIKGLDFYAPTFYQIPTPQIRRWTGHPPPKETTGRTSLPRRTHRKPFVLLVTIRRSGQATTPAKSPTKSLLATSVRGSQAVRCPRLGKEVRVVLEAIPPGMALYHAAPTGPSILPRHLHRTSV